MANKVTQDDIIRFNELYYENKNYSKTARETGFAPATVKRYIIPNYVPLKKIEKKVFTEDLIPEDIDFSLFKNNKNWASLCVLTEEERLGIAELHKEMSI
ncbi:MAG: hypothetical protein LIR46_02540 [Bacteroidota bacterium]|nr:hypothetical protein [Bacteroidota bacterium]